MWRFGSSLDLERAHNPKVAGSKSSPRNHERRGVSGRSNRSPLSFTQTSPRNSFGLAVYHPSDHSALRRSTRCWARPHQTAIAMISGAARMKLRLPRLGLRGSKDVHKCASPEAARRPGRPRHAGERRAFTGDSLGSWGSERRRAGADRPGRLGGRPRSRAADTRASRPRGSGPAPRCPRPRARRAGHP